MKKTVIGLLGLSLVLTSSVPAYGMLSQLGSKTGVSLMHCRPLVAAALRNPRCFSKVSPLATRKRRVETRRDFNQLWDRAVVKGEADAIDQLVLKGADLNAKRDSVPGFDITHGMPPLHEALIYWNFKTAERLLEKGADPDSRDKEGNAPLHIAGERITGTLDNPGCISHEFVSKLLEAGANPNVRNNFGSSPLHLMPSSYPCLIKMLLDLGAKPNVVNDAGNTAVHNTMFSLFPYGPSRDTKSRMKKSRSLLLEAGADRKHLGWTDWFRSFFKN